MNLEAFENLSRVLRTVSQDELRMGDWNSCAIGHATRDAWFQERGLRQSFSSCKRIFRIQINEAALLFTAASGETPDQVIAAIDEFVRVARESENVRAIRRQRIIDEMLRTARNAEKMGRRVVVIVAAALGF